MATSVADTITAIETALGTLLHGVTGLAVVNGRQAGTRPTGQFVEFMIVRVEGTDWPVTDYVDPPVTLTEYISDPTYMTAQITANGVDAFKLLTKFKLVTRSQPRNWDLFNLVGLGGCDEIQNTTTEFAAVTMPQASVNFNFYAMLTESQVVEYFTSDQTTVAPIP
jgi:hypothetical protein